MDIHIRFVKEFLNELKRQRGDIYTLRGGPLKLVDRFSNLGSSVSSTEKDNNTQLAKAWTSNGSLSVIWKSDLTDKIKLFFPSSGRVDTAIWLHNMDAKKKLEKKLDSNNTRMLQAVLNKSWKQHPQSSSCTATIPPITKTTQVRRTRHAGHCWRNKDELISDILWTPSQGRAEVRRPARTYIQQLSTDTWYSLEDLQGAMEDRDGWRERVRETCAGSATWWWWWWV